MYVFHLDYLRVIDPVLHKISASFFSRLLLESSFEPISNDPSIFIHFIVKISNLKVSESEAVRNLNVTEFIKSRRGLSESESVRITQNRMMSEFFIYLKKELS